MVVYWIDGVFPLGLFGILLYGGLILFAIGYLGLRSLRFLKSHLTRQNRDLYDFIEALKMHYASNEISDEELVRMKNTLLQS
jgi:hypothetical protein